MKFNVGDKCKVISQESNGFSIGEIVKIINIVKYQNIYIATNDKQTFLIKEEELEKVNTRRFEYVSSMKNMEFSLPKRSTKNSAGYDFINPEHIIIPPYKLGDKPILVPTGVKVLMPKNEFLMLVNRSSNPKKKNLVIPNSLGVIDAKIA